MHGNTRLAAIALTALALAGCEDSTPVAVEGSEIILAASPTNITVPDPMTGNGTSNITATVLNPSGVPQDGVAVFFSTTAGSLQSNGVSVETDDNGLARDVLTTRQSAQITARSGSASAQVTVTFAGQALVGQVILSATTPTSCTAPCTVSFTATVRDTNGNVISGALVSPDILGDGNPSPAPPYTTNAQGTVMFDVTGITQDNTSVAAFAGGVSSERILITITPTP
jgi:hypothetical protein